MIKTEHKYIEILRILKDHQEPMGAKRLSEILAERGYVMTDRAVQYYLRYLDNRGFTEKVGNQGRVLTPAGIMETDRALVDDRIGFVISKLERLAFRSTFDPDTATGDVAYNLTIVPDEILEPVCERFDKVRDAGCSFFSGYSFLDRDPRVPSGYTGILTVCSITMDGVFQHNGIPVKVAYGGRSRLSIKDRSGLWISSDIRAQLSIRSSFLLALVLLRSHPISILGQGSCLQTSDRFPVEQKNMGKV
jgi:repressor of nif and glnA expression